MIHIQNLCGIAILISLIPTLVGVKNDGIISSSIHSGSERILSTFTKNVLNMANSADSDETSHYVASNLGLCYL